MTNETMKQFMAAAFVALLALFSGGCSVARGIRLASEAAFDMPRMPKAASTQTKVNPFVLDQDTSNAVIQMEYIAPGTLEDAVAWYQAELTRRGWVVETRDAEGYPKEDGFAVTVSAQRTRGFVDEWLLVSVGKAMNDQSPPVRVRLEMRGNYYWRDELGRFDYGLGYYAAALSNSGPMGTIAGSVPWTLAVILFPVL